MHRITSDVNAVYVLEYITNIATITISEYQQQWTIKKSEDPPPNGRANERTGYRLRFAAKVKIQYGASSKRNKGTKQSALVTCA